jgi:hypothetical protein
VIRESRQTDADEAERARPVPQRAVEQLAREVADPLPVVGADGQ